MPESNGPRRAATNGIETAVVLVAGVGSRLRPLTDECPKALIPLGDETILGRALRLLSAAGVRHAVLATGYREADVKRALDVERSARRAAAANDGVPLELTFCPNLEYESTQNSVSLHLCASALGGRGFFKLDGDVVFEGAVLERLLAAEGELRVAVDGRRVLDGEAMKVRAEGQRITEFGKGIALDRAHAETIGVELLSARAGELVLAAIAEHVAAGRRGLYYEDVYSELVGAGRLAATAVEVGDLPWAEIDTLEDLAQARALVGGQPSA